MTGIGVTPFASVLKALYHKKMTGAKLKVEKVHFYWSARDVRAFEWFQVLLRGMRLLWSLKGEMECCVRWCQVNVFAVLTRVL